MGALTVAPGSSPLTRGKPGASVGQALATRLIPAHAGKTDVAAVDTMPDTAHPRSRGENFTDLVHQRSHLWLIPAHAGKTAAPRHRRASAPAHPRSRGENRTGL